MDAILKAARTVGRGEDSATAMMIGRCEQERWTAERRRCIADVRDDRDLMACQLKYGPRTPEVVVEIDDADKKRQAARQAVTRFAHDAYPSWAAAHQDKQCPDTLSDLFEYMSESDDRDPWGVPYTMTCGPTNPPGVRGLGVRSAGPDRKAGTTDDIVSWQDR